MIKNSQKLFLTSGNEFINRKFVNINWEDMLFSEERYALLSSVLFNEFFVKLSTTNFFLCSHSHLSFQQRNIAITSSFIQTGKIFYLFKKFFITWYILFVKFYSSNFFFFRTLFYTSTMVFYNPSRLWTREEWDSHLAHARVHCARLGYPEWKRQGKNLTVLFGCLVFFQKGFFQCRYLY